MAKIFGTRSLNRNKKGSLIDLIFIIVGLLIFGVTVLIGFKVLTEWNAKMAVMPGIPAEATASNAKLLSNYSGVIDHSFLILTIGMALGAFILASLVRIHPIFLPFFFIALAFVIFFAGIFSNVYQTMAENPALSAEADQLIFISNILNYLPFIVGIIGSILAIVMYKLWQNSEV